MINVGKTPNYNTLKSAFREGIEFRTIPFKEYMGNKSVGMQSGSELVTKFVNDTSTGILNDIAKDRNPLKFIMSKTFAAKADRNSIESQVLSERVAEKLCREGNTKIADTFLAGICNPSVCFMAWYDALAEHVVSAAEALADSSAPVPVIQEELQKLSKSLSSNKGFNEAKTKVYKALKKLYGKTAFHQTYKARLKLCEQHYNKQVSDGVTNIVRQLMQKA